MGDQICEKCVKFCSFVCLYVVYHIHVKSCIDLFIKLMKKGNTSVQDEEGWKGNSSKRNNSHDLYLQQPVYELTFKLVVNLEVGV